jgi:hydroxyacylglutathione hydrolase
MTAIKEESGMEVITIETPQLGDRTYLVHDGEVGVVIDPQRDTDRIDKAVSDAGVRITHVGETHIHNDYVTGVLQLAKDHGAAYLVNAADDVPYSRQPISDGETVHVGKLTLKPSPLPVTPTTTCPTSSRTATSRRSSPAAACSTAR